MTPHYRRIRALAVGVLALAALVAPRARAEEAVATSAQALFDEGRRLLLDGDYERACAKLAESQLEEPAAGTLLNLAFCHEQLGRTATAYVEYQYVLARSVGAGDEARAALVRQRLAALEPRLVRLRIRLASGSAAETMVDLDGARLRLDALDAPIPIDPGHHRIGGTIGGGRRFTLELVADQPGTTTEITVPPPELSAPPEPGTGATRGAQPVSGAAAPDTARLGEAAPRSSTASVSTDASRDARAGAARTVLSVTTLAVGALGLAAGAYFGLDAFDAWAQRDRHCPRGICDEVAEAAYRRARRSASASNLCFAAGAASGAAGLYLVVRAPSRGSSPRDDSDDAVRASALLVARGRF